MIFAPCQQQPNVKMIIIATKNNKPCSMCHLILVIVFMFYVFVFIDMIAMQ